MKTLKIGHRGAKGYVAENTIASFEKALFLGVDAVEFDIHLSKDKIPVVIHDLTLERTTNGNGLVADKTLTELKQLSIEEKYRIPALEEVLDFVDRRCLVNIELKAKGSSAETVKIIEKYISKGWEYKDFLVSGFDYRELEMVYTENRNIPLGILSEDSIGKAVQKADELHSDTLILHYGLINEEVVKDMHCRGFKVFVWTVNSEDDIRKMKSYGVDAIISDFPDF